MPIFSSVLFLTHHGTVLYVDEATRELRHGPAAQAPRNVNIVKEGTGVTIFAEFAGVRHVATVLRERTVLLPESEAGAPALEFSAGLDVFSLRTAHGFLSAEPDGRVSDARNFAGHWETFRWTRPRTSWAQGTIVRSVHNGRSIAFLVENPLDHIQKRHMQGLFYEQDELDLILRYLDPGARVLDVGANIGNHTVFLALFGNVSEIVCIEPNPRAIRILRENILLNRIEQLVNSEYLGIGLNDRSGGAELGVSPEYNLGLTSLVLNSDGSIPCLRGDELLSGQNFDFIKIDTEGMELNVLEGLSNIIKSGRPIIFVEVDRSRNFDSFNRWCHEMSYQVLEETDVGQAVGNYIITSTKIA